LRQQRQETGQVKGSVQDVAELKVSAVLQVQQDAERLIASVRSLLAADYRLYEAMETERKGRRSA
jgi:hypothetical protein